MYRLLHDVLRGKAESIPNVVALRHESGIGLTYAQLDALSVRWANYLTELVGDGRRKRPYIAVLAPVGPDSVAAILGLLRAGFAYVPLDDRSPSSRLRSVLEQASIEVLIAHPAMLRDRPELLGYPALREVVLCAQGEVSGATAQEKVLAASTEPPSNRNILSEDPVYVLYTSGSTGVPKGIMHTHRSACAFVEWMQREFQLTSSDVVMSRAPWHFDLSVFDVFNTLAAGGTLITYDWTRPRHGDERHRAYVDLLTEQQATVLYTTPSTFIALLQRGGLGKRPTHLRQLMYAGEPFPIAALQALRRGCPQARIANIYGPTETNIITCHRVDDQDVAAYDAIPLGREVDDVEIVLVDDTGELCAPGEIGELWCRGAPVTVGYLGMPEQTAKHLVRSPFHTAPAWFWRTGDLAVRDADGILHYRGRRDHMVKVNGFRVELGEVEATAASYTGVEMFTVVAVASDDSQPSVQLHAFYTSPWNPVPAEALREHLADKLPQHMVPLTLRRLDVMPMTSSGKADRTTLTDIVRNG
ncbi:amino acid adenylation domain-containing protein [Nocardia sp. NPDC005998]|uniref:amino acid adenylation domain-containing protein n=1 Tax=Nocardia sp. NPDC005998 TaxID=3156894 RepID=UPI0033A0EA8E